MIFFIAFFSLTAQAEILKDKIHSVLEDPHGESHIVRFSEGRVGFVSKHLLEEVKNSVGAEVEADLDGKYSLKSFHVTQAPSSSENDLSLKNLPFVDPPAYEPTSISAAQVQEIFQTLNPNFKRLSECSDRAHVWAYDVFKKSGIKSQKAFILFTASYINRVRFKWWFHVAPMFTVGDQKMITDVMYKDRAVTLKEWSDMMVFSLRDCKMTTKFSEYDVNPQTEDCYMIHTNMYYRLPGDIHEEETRGVYRSSWNDFEVTSSRSRAFNIGRIQ